MARAPSLLARMPAHPKFTTIRTTPSPMAPNLLSPAFAQLMGELRIIAPAIGRRITLTMPARHLISACHDSPAPA